MEEAKRPQNCPVPGSEKPIGSVDRLGPAGVQGLSASLPKPSESPSSVGAILRWVAPHMSI